MTHFSIVFQYRDEIATLVIKQTSSTDAGWYRMEAANKLGRVETQCNLVVKSK